MQANADVFSNAFHLLASTVNEFHINGRACLGATLKPRLYQQHFDEKLLGFRKFGDFLRAAEAAGYVKLVATSGGDIGISPGSIPRHLDVAALPPSNAAATPLSNAPSTGVPIRVRQDLWNAFNSLSDKWIYDPISDTAFRQSTGAVGWGEQAVQPRPNTVPIPSGRDRVMEWMRSFTNMQDSDVKAQLSSALEGNAGLYEFNNLVRSKGVLRLWSRYHIQNVLAAIEAWAASNNVHPKNVASPFHAAIPIPLEVKPQEPAPGSDMLKDSAPVLPTSTALNTRLENLIDNLVDELISLRGLLQVIGPKR